MGTEILAIRLPDGSEIALTKIGRQFYIGEGIPGEYWSNRPVFMKEAQEFCDDYCPEAEIKVSEYM